jgi:signal transduction histidine kinase
VVIDGDAAALPPAVDHCAYRILQESLTNVLRHAGPSASASIALRYGPGGLDIAVTDDGAGLPAGPAAGGRAQDPGDADRAAGEPAAGEPAAGDPGADRAAGGHGLTGMAERVSALGGTLRAGPRPGGGFEVRARLPIPAGQAVARAQAR